MGATCGAGTDHPSEAHCVHPRVLNSGVRGARSIVFCAMFCPFFFWPLCCLSFYLQLLIIPLVYSNFSYHVFFFLAGRSLNDYNYFPFYVKVFIVDSTNIAKRGLTDTKGVIRIRISKKNRQHNDQRKTYKRTNNDLQITEDRVTRTTLKTGVNSIIIILG